MSDYRCFVVNASRHSLGSRTFTSTHDGEALELARKMLISSLRMGFGVEVWQGNRFVAVVEPQTEKRAL